ncbi:MAG: hypothetical protein ACLUOI_37805 [Eisenbergiella sp.]
MDTSQPVLLLQWTIITITAVDDYYPGVFQKTILINLMRVCMDMGPKGFMANLVLDKITAF